VPEERQEYFWEIFEQVEEYHPTEPYWYLPVIGADPTHQRKGSGSALMQHVLAKCDHEGTLVYLESSNPENILLYARYGFKILSITQGGGSNPLIAQGLILPGHEQDNRGFSRSKLPIISTECRSIFPLKQGERHRCGENKQYRFSLERRVIMTRWYAPEVATRSCTHSLMAT
jgi:hypothetical protein